jgi:hypothetical protein
MNLESMTIRIKEDYLTDGGKVYSVIIREPINDASIKIDCIDNESATKFYLQFINLIASYTVECMKPLS